MKWTALVLIVAALGDPTPQRSLVDSKSDAIPARALNGAFELRPTDTGPNARVAKCELRRTSDGSTLWKHDFSCDVQDAVVSDEGHVAVYGYTIDALALEIVDESGTSIHRTSIGLASSRIAHGYLWPHVRGHLYLDDGGGLDQFLLLRMPGTLLLGPESWWLYEVHYGRFVGSVTPDGAPDEATAGRGVITSLVAVRGTCMIAVLWRSNAAASVKEHATDLVLYRIDGHAACEQVWRAGPDSFTSTMPRRVEEQTFATALASSQPNIIEMTTTRDEVLRWRVEFAKDGRCTCIRL